MSDQPENPMLILLRRIDAKVDHVLQDMTYIRNRLTTVEIQVSNLAGTESSHYASIALSDASTWWRPNKLISATARSP
jgi:hypothetical protein